MASDYFGLCNGDQQKQLKISGFFPCCDFHFAVTFSRMDPEGKLVMGFRKATNSVPLQVNNIV